ncbi:MAG: orotate phosphoribosyltransferase [Acidimicrobiia bacterium]
MSKTGQLSESEVLEILEASGAILHGHFVLSSGRHSEAYVEKFRAFEYPEYARKLGESLGRRFEDRQVDVVLSPAVGAIVLGFTTALHLGCRFIFSEREEGEMRLRRGFEISAGERVLVIEDVVTTGGSVKELLPLIAPGELAGIGLLVSRGDRSSGAGLPVDPEALLNLPMESWAEADCPLCARGVPRTSRGSRLL